MFTVIQGSFLTMCVRTFTRVLYVAGHALAIGLGVGIGVLLLCLAAAVLTIALLRRFKPKQDLPLTIATIEQVPLK